MYGSIFIVHSYSSCDSKLRALSIPGMYEKVSNCCGVHDRVLMMGFVRSMSRRYVRKQGHSFRRWAKVSSSS